LLDDDPIREDGFSGVSLISQIIEEGNVVLLDYVLNKYRTYDLGRLYSARGGYPLRSCWLHINKARRTELASVLCLSNKLAVNDFDRDDTNPKETILYTVTFGDNFCENKDFDFWQFLVTQGAALHPVPPYLKSEYRKVQQNATASKFLSSMFPKVLAALIAEFARSWWSGLFLLDHECDHGCFASSLRGSRHDDHDDHDERDIQLLCRLLRRHFAVSEVEIPCPRVKSSKRKRAQSHRS
jgi:hypothetical protein